MSKYLVKILSICALVVMMSVAVVGAAVCVTEAIGCSLTVFNGSQTYEGSDSSVTIYIDGEKQEGDKVQVSKYTEITVQFNGTGYDKVKWYEGEFDVNKDKAVATGTTYTFELKKNTKLTAVANLKTYNVKFDGFLADGTTPITSVAGFEGTQVFTYGQEILAPGSNTEELFFHGWNIKTAEGVDARLYKFATFDTNDVTLVPKWDAQEYIDYTINVAYKLGSTDVETLTYNVKDGLSEYTATRDNYKLVGIEFNGKVYAYNEASENFTGLGEAVVRNGETEVNATAVWECIYGSFTFNLEGAANYEDSDLGFGEYGLMATKNGQVVAMRETISNAEFTDEEGENNFDLTDDVYALFVPNYSNFTTLEGTPIDLGDMTATVKVSVNGNSYVAPFQDVTSITFENIITFVEGQLGSLNNVDTFTITFVFGN